MKIISLREAARRLDVSISTLKRMIAAGTIRKVRITERRVGVVEGDLDDLIADLRETQSVA